MYATHRLMVIYTYAKYGKPMSNKKMYGQDTNLHRQTDRETDGQTDRQSNSYIPPWTSFMGGIIRYNAHNPQHTCKSPTGHRIKETKG